MAGPNSIGLNGLTALTLRTRRSNALDPQVRNLICLLLGENMAMDRFEQLVQEFLGKKRVAVWGVEEVKSAGSGHLIVDRLHKQGIQAIAVNPRFSSDPSQQRYSSLTQIEPGIDAVLVYVDRPQTLEAINDCIAAKVPLVWLHDALSPGAAIPEAIEKLRAAGCTVIPGLCPMLYLKPVDPAHFCLKCMLWLAGKSKRVRRNTV